MTGPQIPAHVARGNINALLTAAIYNSDGPNDPIWAMDLDHDELALAASVLARMLVSQWIGQGWDPQEVLAAMIAGTQALDNG